MSNVVFILGAGASRMCGAPLMADFLDVASDLLRAGRVAQKRAQFERVFSAIGGLQAVHSKAQLDLSNVESVFNALELGRLIRCVPGIAPEEIPVVISSLKDLIVGTIEATVQFPVLKRSIGVPPPYKEFADLLWHLRKDANPPLTVSVITFNYDIAADMGLYRTSLGPDYGLDAAPEGSETVALLKLHGSLNWALEVGTGRVRPLPLSHYFKRVNRLAEYANATVSVPIGSQLAEFFSKVDGVLVDSEPVIVPPSWNKAEHHQALSEVWAGAARELSEAEHIFVVGYSLPETDAFFRHLYALGCVGRAPLKRFMVFNPDDTGQIDSRFRSLLGPGAAARYEYSATTFDKAIPLIKRLFPKRG